MTILYYNYNPSNNSMSLVYKDGNEVRETEPVIQSEEFEHAFRTKCKLTPDADKVEKQD